MNFHEKEMERNGYEETNRADGAGAVAGAGPAAGRRAGGPQRQLRRRVDLFDQRSWNHVDLRHGGDERLRIIWSVV